MSVIFVDVALLILGGAMVMIGAMFYQPIV